MKEQVYLGDYERLSHKYRGCGNGYIRVTSEGDVVDYGYLDENNRPQDQQNVWMRPDAGKVFETYPNGDTSYFCNFSCWTACLF